MLKLFFNTKSISRDECVTSTKKSLENATRYQLLQLLKDYGYYNEYKDSSNTYIINFFIRKSYENNRIYKIF